MLRKFGAGLALGALIAAGAAQAQDRTGWPTDMAIATASQGGTYFTYGNGLAAFISEALGVNVSGEVTGGPVQNATLVQTNQTQLGMVTMGPMFSAWTGKSELAPGLEHKDVRALFPMYETPFHAVTLRSSGITTVTGMAGKRVGVGPAGGTPGTYWPLMLEALGVDATTSYAGAADTAGQLKDGLVDVFAFAAGLPTGAFSQLAAEADAVFIGFTPEEHAKVLEAFPSVAPFTIPAGTYSGQDEDQQTVAMWNFAIAHKDVPESLAYEITKLVMENHERMMQIHSAASATVLENWVNNSFLPFHPGAVRYFEERGLTVPDNLKG